MCLCVYRGIVSDDKLPGSRNPYSVPLLAMIHKSWAQSKVSGILVSGQLWEASWSRMVQLLVFPL